MIKEGPAEKECKLDLSHLFHGRVPRIDELLRTDYEKAEYG